MIKQDITSFLINEKEILDGHLIGDASVFKTGSDCKRNCVMVIASKHEEYTEWIVANTKTFSTCNINNYDVYDKRTKKAYHRSVIKSYSNVLLTERRQLWYPEGKKIIPRNLCLSPELVLRWYMDDGTYHSKGIYLCTNGYSFEDNQYLQNELSVVTGCVVNIHKHSKNSFRLFIPKGGKISPSNNYKKFLDYIRTCPVSCFKHKWGE